MLIDINQAKIALTDKYRVFVNEEQEPTLRAARKFWRAFAEVDLFRLPDPAADAGTDPEPVLTLKKRFSILKASYEIFRGNESYSFTTQSIWKPQYQCIAGPDDQYRIYAHRGRKYSVFRNDRQVCWWEKAMISWFAGDNYRITCDDDADIELLIGFCLIIDNYSSDDHDSNTVNFDFGNLLQAKKFDAGWQPRTRK